MLHLLGLYCLSNSSLSIYSTAHAQMKWVELIEMVGGAGALIWSLYKRSTTCTVKSNQVVVLW